MCVFVCLWVICWMRAMENGWVNEILQLIGLHLLPFNMQVHLLPKLVHISPATREYYFHAIPTFKWFNCFCLRSFWMPNFHNFESVFTLFLDPHKVPNQSTSTLHIYNFAHACLWLMVYLLFYSFLFALLVHNIYHSA